MNFSNEPTLLATNITKSYVLEVAGVKIGVIGYLTPNTASESNPEKVIFYDEVQSIQNESERLNKNGVKIIIALGHSGYEVDKKIAKEVPLVDVVVGGHSHTFLNSGKQPDKEVSKGPYPTVVTQKTGKKVPVVQAFCNTKYMGRLTVVFNDKGDLIKFEGSPQLLNSSVPQDPKGLKLLETFRPKHDAVHTKAIGVARSYLDGDWFKCRVRECNLLNFITDAFFTYHMSKYEGYYWTDASVAIVNAGCVRTGIGSQSNRVITKGNILDALPFEDVVYIISIMGKDLLHTLEMGVRGEGDGAHGELLHSSGIFYTYDISKEIGSRIIQAKIRCSNCTIPTFESIVPNKMYKIIVNGFVGNGGDGHDIIRTNGWNKTIEDKSTWEIIEWYIKKMTPIYAQEEGRIIEYRSNKASTIIIDGFIFMMVLITHAVL